MIWLPFALLCLGALATLGALVVNEVVYRWRLWKIQKKHEGLR